MCRANQLFGVGPLFALKAGIETIRLLIENAALGGNRSFSALNVARPVCRTVLMNSHSCSPFGLQRVKYRLRICPTLEHRQFRDFHLLYRQKG